MKFQKITIRFQKVKMTENPLILKTTIIIKNILLYYRECTGECTGKYFFTLHPDGDYRWWVCVNF